MRVKIKTLTPIWTGDVNRECTKLRETSIVGSLRWWFEAIVRGFGGHACDPTSDSKCEFDVKKYKRGAKPEELICPACYVIGTTNWAKRFKFEINGEPNQVPFVTVKADERKGHKGWFLGKDDSGGILGEFIVDIRETYGKCGKCNDLVALLLHISSSWGIGARTQDGFGICKFEGDYNFNKALNQIENLISTTDFSVDVLPNLKDFFFAEIIINEDINEKIRKIFDGKLYKKVKESGKIKEIDINEFLSYLPENYRGQFYPTAPLVRSWLRGLFRNGNDDLRHFLFGFVSIKGHPTPMCKRHLIHTIRRDRGYFCSECDKYLKDDELYEKMGSKVFVSHLYHFDDTWRFKIWGYIPRTLPNNMSRDEISEKLYQEIVKKKEFVKVLGLNDCEHIDIKWYEVPRTCNDMEELLKKIINGDEK